MVGGMSSGVAFTLQIFGQKYAVPSQAAVIMSLEGVFGALSSVLILHEAMSLAQVVAVA
jgi:drug/metabolite transporter (DMT)-like permease